MSERRRVPDFSPPSPEKEDRIRIFRELEEYIDQIGATSREVARATLMALGKPVEGTMREAVYELSQKIGVAIGHGYTEEDFEELARELYGRENPDDEVDEILGMLSITEYEKELVERVLVGELSGVLMVCDRATGQERGSRMFGIGDASDTRARADRLISFLGGYIGSESIEIRFFELE